MDEVESFWDSEVIQVCLLLRQKNQIANKFPDFQSCWNLVSRENPGSRLLKSGNYSFQMEVDEFAYYAYNYTLKFVYTQIT